MPLRWSPPTPFQRPGISWTSPSQIHLRQAKHLIRLIARLKLEVELAVESAREEMVDRSETAEECI